MSKAKPVGTMSKCKHVDILFFEQTNNQNDDVLLWWKCANCDTHLSPTDETQEYTKRELDKDNEITKFKEIVADKHDEILQLYDENTQLKADLEELKNRHKDKCAMYDEKYVAHERSVLRHGATKLKLSQAHKEIEGAVSLYKTGIDPVVYNMRLDVHLCQHCEVHQESFGGAIEHLDDCAWRLFCEIFEKHNV